MVVIINVKNEKFVKLNIDTVQSKQITIYSIKNKIKQYFPEVQSDADLITIKYKVDGRMTVSDDNVTIGSIMQEAGDTIYLFAQAFDQQLQFSTLTGASTYNDDTYTQQQSNVHINNRMQEPQLVVQRQSPKLNNYQNTVQQYIANNNNLLKQHPTNEQSQSNNQLQIFQIPINQIKNNIQSNSSNQIVIPHKQDQETIQSSDELEESLLVCQLQQSFKKSLNNTQQTSLYQKTQHVAGTSNRIEELEQQVLNQQLQLQKSQNEIKNLTSSLNYYKNLSQQQNIKIRQLLQSQNNNSIDIQINSVLE